MRLTKIGSAGSTRQRSLTRALSTDFEATSSSRPRSPSSTSTSERPGATDELDGVEGAKPEVRRNRPLHPVLAERPDVPEHRTLRDRRPSALVARVHRRLRLANPSRQVDERHPALDVARLHEAHLDTGLGARERPGRVPRLLVVLAADRAPVLAPVVFDGLERLARVAAEQLVREDLAGPRRGLDTPRAPVLVHELADERLGVGAAEDLHPVRLVAERAQDQHVLEPLDPAAFLDRGAPLGDDALDVRAPAAVEPFGRFLAMLRDEAAGDGVDELGVRRHVVLPAGKIRSGVVSPALSEPLPERPPSARLDSGWRGAVGV